MTLDPSAGGVVLGYTTHLRDSTLHWFTPADTEHPACFPMVPFCSRIGGGRFTFEGVEVHLSPNHPSHRQPIHGHGFLRPWEVLEHAADRIVIGYEHAADEWPWAYRARASYQLDAAALRVEMSVENLSGHAMPAGLGLHPYLACPPGTQLQADVAAWLRLDEALMPVAVEQLPAHLDLVSGIAVNDKLLDHVFLACRDGAKVTWQEGLEASGVCCSMQLSSSAPHLVVWAPGEGYFCVEGVSNVPDAFNGHVEALLGSDSGFVRISPGGIHTLVWNFRPQWEYK